MAKKEKKGPVRYEKEPKKDLEDYEWSEKETDINNHDTGCDGCGLIRPLRTIKNKKTKQKLNVCRGCFGDGFFKHPDAVWRKR